ncbi:glycosyltransferase [Candidatus Saccharibacteria bacterium CG11_big_fil_rev_8_21_14_0_20_41_19]|nr:glycosyltransferase family 2 protein [Candidatus Saccharibacteria bacterium]OIP85468.1 MAG: glycosyltransferase [Candidatus Saccharibacteria bacterium CG2_30_41_52]PIQ71248.1 MAG: glycosyltransferase [Candidatus Saccharibacteria bacterium CG11_big_fil_rev_8_21_14_0_20_41_19]PIZ59805.1 MAG: glycosyltransferase [Candidatus Saccharibacteria bacterium CG_4_10_14_0_2_um_filter_41_11]PJC29851.1 MAG: glycosyltransferase [Candidatus Saccharibacteria bacterium CG_4_9_14_0_2_um_filter_41_9]PJE66469.1
MKKISILIPTYNEQEVLEHLYQRLGKLANDNRAYEFEFLFINDGSRDKTLEIIKGYAENDNRIAYVNLSRNFGKEIAMIAGLDHVTGDATVIIDADLQDPPELIPKMIKYWEEGYDDVYAKRNSRDGETWFKKVTSKLYYQILQKVTHIKIQKDTGDFRLLDRRCVEALKQIRESQRYTKGMFSWIGFEKKEITYDRDPRIAGTSKWNYLKLFNFAIDGITSFTTAPLRISSFVGFIVSVISFIYIVIVVIRTTLNGSDVAGYPSLMAAVLFLGGVQLLSLGIIGEYIGRIFNETKQRPLYFVEDYHSGKHVKKAR